MRDRAEFVPAELKALMKDQDLKSSDAGNMLRGLGIMEKKMESAIMGLYRV